MLYRLLADLVVLVHLGFVLFVVLGGPLVLRPSSPSYHYIWRAWLGQAGGWGCGSKAADASLVSLDPIA